MTRISRYFVFYLLSISNHFFEAFSAFQRDFRYLFLPAYFIESEIYSRVASVKSCLKEKIMAEPERCPQDVFEILFASDVHLGFGSKDALRAQDSMQTFEEILRVGRERGVDFVLLGGDLFHQSSPPKHVMDAAIRALRKYCLGDRRANFDLSGELKGSCASLNFKDANLNVALPVFTIHGVHDDPAGK